MKETSTHQKTSQGKANHPIQRVSAGPGGISVPPPIHGIENDTKLLMGSAFGPGRHIHHEAWHIVQQKQRALQPKENEINPITTPVLQLANKKKKKKRSFQPRGLSEDSSSDSSSQDSSSEESSEDGFPEQKQYYFTRDPMDEIDYRGNRLFKDHVDKLTEELGNDRQFLMGELKDRKDLKNIKPKKFTYQDQLDWKQTKKNIKNTKTTITEKIGEFNATVHMQEEHPNAKLIYGYTKGRGFDQIYKEGNRIFVVEAKGPNGRPLMTAGKGRQGSPEWIHKTAQGLRKNKSTRLQNVGKQVQTALKNRNLVMIFVYSDERGRFLKDVTSEPEPYKILPMPSRKWTKKRYVF